MLPLETNIKEAYQGGTDDEQNFIQNLSLFLCTFLKEHAQLVEKKAELNTLLMEVCSSIHTLYILQRIAEFRLVPQLQAHNFSIVSQTEEFSCTSG